MKKAVVLILFLFSALCISAETVFTFTSADDMSQTVDGVTILIAKGSGQTAPNATMDYETQKPEMRLYLGNTITVSGTELTDIQLVFAKSSASNKAYAGLSASTGTLESGGASESKTDWKTDSWTGNATQVVFTLTGSGQRQIRQIVIGGEPVVIGPEETVLPTEEDLDPTAIYSEPTSIYVPDTTIFGQEYAFISNNILVHCSEGSIMRETEEEAAYFGCRQSQQLTFTAARPIVRLEIDGNVRKLFSATCDKGTIQYESDPDLEIAGYPVLTISDINATSVTIHCDKNLSCYEARAYFSDTTDSVALQKADTKAVKIVRNGNIYIQKNGRLFTVIGTEVQ